MRSFEWRISFGTPAEKVYHALASGEGRAAFWAEKAVETDGVIDFHFPNGERYEAEILEQTPLQRFSLRYFGAVTTFDITEDGTGSVMTLSVSEAPEDDWLESYAGWISVLMNMKAVLDFGADLRNHDARKSWDQGFVDN